MVKYTESTFPNTSKMYLTFNSLCIAVQNKTKQKIDQQDQHIL